MKIKAKTKLYFCCVHYQNHVITSIIPCSMVKKIVTLEEVQTALRTNALTNLKDLKVDNSGECLSVSRGRGGSRGNHVNLEVGDKVKYKCFKCHKTSHFKKNFLRWEGNDDSVQLIVTS